MRLEERDEALLEALGSGVCSEETLVDSVEMPAEEVASRLADLVDNGLVDELGSGTYERSESGRRVLMTSVGATDERIDSTPEVERVIAERDLGPDAADAVRHVYSFVRYWGQVTEGEIVDAIFGEAPAGYESPSEWWSELIRDSVAAISDIDPPPSKDAPWRFSGRPEATTPGADGRRVLSRTRPVFGDVTHAIQSLELSDAEREAAQVAFQYLHRHGECTQQAIAAASFDVQPAGLESPDRLWERAIGPVFETAPGIERIGPDSFRYRPPWQ